MPPEAALWSAAVGSRKPSEAGCPPHPWIELRLLQSVEGLD